MRRLVVCLTALSLLACGESTAPIVSERYRGVFEQGGLDLTLTDTVVTGIAMRQDRFTTDLLGYLNRYALQPVVFIANANYEHSTLPPRYDYHLTGIVDTAQRAIIGAGDMRFIAVRVEPGQDQPTLYCAFGVQGVGGVPFDPFWFLVAADQRAEAVVQFGGSIPAYVHGAAVPNPTGGSDVTFIMSSYSGLRQPGDTFVTLHIAGTIVNGKFDNGVSSGNMVGGVCGV
jgi:hypothetical protein